MSASVVDIADAVTGVLNGASLSQSFVAERVWVLSEDLQDMEPASVFVIPTAFERTAWDLNRRTARIWDIAVWVQKRFTVAPSISEVDPYMTLLEEIADLFHPKMLLGSGGAQCIGVTSEPPYDATLLDTHRLFRTALVFKFRLTRP